MVGAKLQGVFFSYLREALETLYTDLAEIHLRESQSEEENEEEENAKIIPSLCWCSVISQDLKTFPKQVGQSDIKK